MSRTMQCNVSLSPVAVERRGREMPVCPHHAAYAIVLVTPLFSDAPGKRERRGEGRARE